MDHSTVASSIGSSGIRPVRNRFLVMQHEAQTMEGGIHLPHGAVDPPNIGTVVAVGDGCPEFIKVGTVVQWPSTFVVRMNVGGFALVLMSPEDVGCYRSE